MIAPIACACQPSHIKGVTKRYTGCKSRRRAKMKFILIVLSAMAVCVSSDWPAPIFPESFLFGAASTAYQTEGAWNISGKGENIWDYLTHTFPNRIVHNDSVGDSNADIGPDTYHNYKRDVEMMRELRLDAYRLSLSWTRLLPNGLLNHLNKDGVNFYNNYIDEMLKYNITPIVTLFDMDLPLFLHKHGGFTSAHVTEWFDRYARLAYMLFGNRVKHWITFGNPQKFCSTVYGRQSLFDNPTVLNNTNSNTTLFVKNSTNEFLCVKNVLISHSRAYKTYKRDFQPVQKGVCGISVVVNWYVVVEDSMKLVAPVLMESEWGIFTDPIFSSKGGFPKLVLKDQKYCFICGMPQLSDKERQYIKGSSDFLALDTYFNSQLAYATAMQLTANVFGVVLTFSKRYHNPEIFITTGFPAQSTYGPSDDKRVEFLRTVFYDTIQAYIRGIHVKGLFISSLMDSFEWENGYSYGYGLYHVNYSDPQRTRTARKSALYYKYLTYDRMVDDSYEPMMTKMKIGPLEP